MIRYAIYIWYILCWQFRLVQAECAFAVLYTWKQFTVDFRKVAQKELRIQEIKVQHCSPIDFSFNWNWNWANIDVTIEWNTSAAIGSVWWKRLIESGRLWNTEHPIWCSCTQVMVTHSLTHVDWVQTSDLFCLFKASSASPSECGTHCTHCAEWAQHVCSANVALL